MSGDNVALDNPTGTTGNGSGGNVTIAAGRDLRFQNSGTIAFNANATVGLFAGGVIRSESTGRLTGGSLAVAAGNGVDLLTNFSTVAGTSLSRAGYPAVYNGGVGDIGLFRIANQGDVVISSVTESLLGGVATLGAGGVDAGASPASYVGILFGDREYRGLLADRIGRDARDGARPDGGQDRDADRRHLGALWRQERAGRPADRHQRRADRQQRHHRRDPPRPAAVS